MARDYQYADYRGIERGTREEHLRAASVLMSGGVDPAHWLPALEPWLTGSDVPQVSWERVSQQQALTESDGHLVYELVRERGDEQDIIRGFLFDSIFRIFERRPTA